MHHGSGCDEDSCAAAPPYSASAAVLLCSPLLATFLAVSTVAGLRLFPRLSRAQGVRDGDGYALPPSAPPSLQQAHSEHSARSPWRRAAAAGFGVTMGLSAVLAELILAQVLAPAGTSLRDAVVRLTVQALLLLLVIGMQAHAFLITANL